MAMGRDKAADAGAVYAPGGKLNSDGEKGQLRLHTQTQTHVQAPVAAAAVAVAAEKAKSLLCLVVVVGSRVFSVVVVGVKC
jgi:hypothetical protein